MEARQYHEAGATYCIPPFAHDEFPLNGMKRFSYLWQHKETGRVGSHAIYCFNLKDAEKLVSYWDSKTEQWDYSNPTEQQ